MDSLEENLKLKNKARRKDVPVGNKVTPTLMWLCMPEILGLGPRFSWFKMSLEGCVGLCSTTIPELSLGTEWNSSDAGFIRIHRAVNRAGPKPLGT